MIADVLVIHASAVVASLICAERAHVVDERFGEMAGRLAAPALLDIEVAHGLRRWVAAKRAHAALGRQALDDLVDLGVQRYRHEPLLGRIWELRNNLTAYDAAYVALAEALDAPLLTLDASLASAPGHHARVETP